MVEYKNIRGTHDLYGESLEKFAYVEEVTKKVASYYNFKEIRTPIIEYLQVFEKNIGDETADIIGKEMYTFEDRSGDKIVLRPEGTAPVVRSLISEGLTHKLPLKYFYMGAMFRYERPQKGRQRQFHQLGFEYLGTNHYSSDVEMINLALDILESLGITSYKLHINSLGSSESLNAYKQALVDFLQSKKNELSEDSLNRLLKNPLRILDSKSPQDKEIIKDAPKIADFLIKEDKEFFNKVKESLTNLGISYTEDSNLVRGLDYYTHTVFEIITDQLGSQGTLIAGGRYNNLIKQMGGNDTGAFGFAGGIERLALMLNAKKESPKNIALITSAEDYNQYALTLAKKLREANFGATLILGKDVSNKLKKVEIADFFCSIIIGDTEHSTGELTLKDVANREQFKVKEEALVEFLSSQYGKYKI
ncbi:MAG: histidine--tRNA ligase [Alphaproteobacteria bacterium]|jgi:histidyl-tRNA synthetase|nr:histidine--tRNA ligase [Alphaproteobacteria bacterium]